MPLSSACLGSPAGRLTVDVDRRWTMAYAAGVPDERPELIGRDPHGSRTVHPLFPVAPEWALVTATRPRPTDPTTGLTATEVRRGLHLAHDLVLERPLATEFRAHLHAVVGCVDRRRAGATYETHLTARDDDGQVMWRTRNTSLFLGVELAGESASLDVEWPETPLRPDVSHPEAQRSSFVGGLDAHVYSECARIWNPIHTDVEAAHRAGLDAPILHGTATLARAVSIATELATWPIAQVGRIAGRFAAAVDLGTTIHVRLLAGDARHLWFDVVRDDGRVAIADGLIARL